MGSFSAEHFVASTKLPRNVPLRETGDFIWRLNTNKVIEVGDVISVSNSLDIEDARMIKLN